MPLIDFPPWLQTVLTLAAVALVIAHHVGRYLLRRDPASVWGARLVIIGVGLHALRRHPAAHLLPPPVRAALDSLTESDPPASRCRVDDGCSRPDGHAGRCEVPR